MVVLVILNILVHAIIIRALVIVILQKVVIVIHNHLATVIQKRHVLVTRRQDVLAIQHLLVPVIHKVVAHVMEVIELVPAIQDPLALVMHLDALVK